MSYTIHDIETTEPLSDIYLPADSTGIALLLRHQGRPVAFLMKGQRSRRVTTTELTGIIAMQVDDTARISRLGSPVSLPSLTVAICTRDNAALLNMCLNRLYEVQQQIPLNFEILVVDNAPSNRQTRDVVAAQSSARYSCEPKPGLNFARNRALQEASGDIIAFIDDDVIVDHLWLHGLAHAIEEHPDAVALTGLVLPLELETEAQILFEERGGFEKSFHTIRYGPSLPGHPFYPCIGGKFGTGCNMAFRRTTLIELGGFDEALDTGSPLPGGGDTDVFYRVVRAGYPLVYEPQFMVFHKHRRRLDQLQRQYVRSWAMGLMAFVTKTYITDAAQRRNLRRLVFWWFKNQLHELWHSLHGQHVLPARMVLAEFFGAVAGILGAYQRSDRRIEKIRRQYAGTSCYPHNRLATMPHHEPQPDRAP